MKTAGQTVCSVPPRQRADYPRVSQAGRSHKEPVNQGGPSCGAEQSCLKHTSFFCQRSEQWLKVQPELKQLQDGGPGLLSDLAYEALKDDVVCETSRTCPQELNWGDVTCWCCG